MATKFNPFHQWLGLDKKLTNPHHFQLLGVSPKIADVVAFKKLARANAKRHLEKLKSVSVEAGQESLKAKLKARIVQAHDILIDDQKRASYVKQLKTKAKQAKSGGSSKLPSAPPRSKSVEAPAPVKRPAEAPDASSNAVEANLDADSPAAQSAPAAIPMALPLTPSITEAPTVAPSGNTGNADYQTVVVEPEGVVLAKSDSPSFEGLDSGGEVQVHAARRPRRKKSWMLPIVTVLFIAAGMIGIASLVLNYDNLFSSLRKPDVVTTENGDTVKPGGELLPDTKTIDGPPIGEPSTPLTKDELKKVMSDTRDLDVPAASEDDPEVDVNGEMAEDDGDAASDKMTDEDDETADPETPENPFGTVKLGDNQVATIMFSFQRARNLLARGDDHGARQVLAFVQRELKDVAVVKEQQAIKVEAEAAMAVADEVTGFWEQVKKSCQAMAGGQEVPVGDQVIAMVEGRADDVVLAIGGDRNVFIPYHSLRPGLARALANMGAKANVPTWRFQEAAHYAVHASEDSQHNRSAIKLIKLSEADGYDGKKIREFIRGDFKSLRQEIEAAEPLSKERLAELQKEIRGQKYEDPLSEVPRDATTYADQHLQSMPKDPEVRVAQLYDAYLLSIAAQKPFQMLDVVDELKRWSKVNAPKLLMDGFVELSDMNLGKPEVRKFGEAFLEFLETSESDALKDKDRAQMKQGALEMLDKAGLKDLSRRLKQKMLR